MKNVDPQVFLLSEPMLKDLCEWLESLDGVDALDHTDDSSDAEILCEMAGRRCYKSFKPGLNPNVTKVRDNSVEYFKNLIGLQHGSVLEHVQVSFAFENVSRVFTHELVRHRVGTAISQESLRYVRLDDLPFWIPPEIKENPEALKVFEETIQYLEKQQKKLAEVFNIDGIKDFGIKKKLTSAFRRIVPEGVGTGIVWSANFRTLRHVIELRTSPHAEVEMRIVFGKVAEICQSKWPMIFFDMKRDPVDGYYAYTFENKKI